MNLSKFFALIAVPFAVMTLPMTAQAGDAEKAADAGNTQMEKTVLASNKDGKKEEEKDGKKSDGEKDGK